MLRRLPKSPVGVCLMSAILLFGFVTTPASAGQKKRPPEYMKLYYSADLALEIEGEWDGKDKVFRASDIEALPRGRSPKLRGPIESIDRDNRTITLYGRTIHVTPSTMFVNADSTADLFSKLKAGQFVEISCKAKSADNWRARKIKTGAIKQSRKIKSSIQRYHIDGTPPDTLEIYGLKVILDENTDVNEQSDEIGLFEQDVFDYAGYSSPTGPKDGFLVNDHLLFSASYRGPITSENEFDLSPINKTDLEELEPSLRLGLAGYWAKNVTTFTQLRMRKRFLLSNERTPEPNKNLRAQFTQFYALFRNLAGVKGLALAVGRQDIEDEREWLFDEYLDAVRLMYYGHKSFIGEVAFVPSIVPVNPKFEPWTDVYVRADWRLFHKAKAGAYFFKRSDISPRNREPVWWGARFYGDVIRGVRPWADVSLMRGTDKGRTLKAWAMDVGVTLEMKDNQYRPGVTIGFARASGDKVKGDGRSEEFRQTGYEDNVARLNGVSGIRYYGEGFNPELSNLTILTLGAGFRPIYDASIEAVFHTYRQVEIVSDITDSDLLQQFVRPNGASDDLGREIDIIASSPRILERARLRLTLAFFTPGDAFLPRQETAFLSKLDVDMEL